MGKINNYSVDSVNPGDKMLCSDAFTGQTKNVTAQSISDLSSSSVVYRAYLTQSGNTAPVATELPGNTLTGEWVYEGTGYYLFQSIGAFDGVKVGVICSLPQGLNVQIVYSGHTDDYVDIVTYFESSLENDLMEDQYIEIFTHDI
jgi:hypothetical protein